MRCNFGFPRMKTVKRGASLVRYGTVAGSEAGVLEIIGSGPMDEDGFLYFMDMMSKEIQESPAFVIRMERVLNTMSSTLCPRERADRLDLPASAIVVRQDQYEVWQSYTLSLAKIGVRRVVFLDDEVEAAYEYAEHSASVRARRDRHGAPIVTDFGSL